MCRHRQGSIRLVCSLLVIFGLGCAQHSSEDSISADDSTATTGMTYEENRFHNPPPPEDLKASLTKAGVELVWRRPYRVEEETGYAKLVVGYKVYRSDAGRFPILIAETRALIFRDLDVTRGEHYEYSIVAIYKSGHDSVPSESVYVDP